MRQFAKIRENTRASGGITILSSAQFATVRVQRGEPNLEEKQRIQ
jgi:hypothetical protein